jgi:hypothetical protein
MGQSTLVGAAELQSAFQTFNQLSRQFIKLYTSLHKRVVEFGRGRVKTCEAKMSGLAENEQTTDRLTSILHAPHLNQSRLSTENQYAVVEIIQRQIPYIENLVYDVLNCVRGDRTGNYPVTVNRLLVNVCLPARK